MLHGGGSAAERKATEQQLNRACEACRLSKVRCLVSPSSSQCQRCAKAGRTCVFAAPAKRRQRKRTDVRVAELEKEVKQMRSLLKTNQISPIGESEPESMDEDADENDDQLDRDSPLRLSSKENAPPPEIDDTERWGIQMQNRNIPIAPFGPDSDIVERELISMEQAQEMLDLYRDHLTEQVPSITISHDWTAQALRSKKPALFHAVMAAASHSRGTELSNRLFEEVVYLYAREIFIGGEKTLQHVQALLVTVAYYTPPKTPSHLQIYQYGNMAASMALELGLASKPRTHEQLPKRAIRSLQRISSQDELLENCRTVLVLYVLTAGFSMRLRRPNILPWNGWLEECLGLLQKSPIIDDKRNVAWVQLQRIADEAHTAFGFDDASTSFSLSELRLQVILRIFERRMLEWKRSLPIEVQNLALLILAHHNCISTWEFAMDGGRYDAPDYRNRFLTLPALDDDEESVQPETLLSRSALQINATIKCIGEAQSLLDCFIQMPADVLPKAPNLLFVRVIYGFVALLKADYAVGTDAEGLGGVLDSQTLKVDYYFDTVLHLTEAAIGPQRCRVPTHWFFVLNQKLKVWHDQHQQWRKEGKHLRKPSPRDGSAGYLGGGAEALGMGRRDVTPTTAAQHMPTPDSSRNEFPPPARLPTRAASASASANPQAFGLPQQTQSQPPSQPQSQGHAQSQSHPPQSPFTPWPANGQYLPGSEHPGQAVYDAGVGGAGGMGEMGDLSAATMFQHGDLFLWNDVGDTIYGGWPGGTGGQGGAGAGGGWGDLTFGGGMGGM
ncbi:hypothetical protein K491DRAFT_590315 [Lophiostoma macrostomum CBS 122681]|uniref:Zn(2)-C6 fungal-type domain-containing protein n=1 Tax=Lophiostoma macrostomum CBS 122681 TaxID=1314788 RepID=A0A6A6TMM3_9PLEO|nr:hypothetical protein K491DRAFT_590315 [Lophiostoma macrostomum CBS 122681]